MATAFLNPAPEGRLEHDLLGEMMVPAPAYYGIHTARAMENFPISGDPLSRLPELIVAIAAVKQAAARANRQLGLLDKRRADAIESACEEIRAGKLHEEFTVDSMQGGAGTSTNMAANEVIANRALELLGRPKGDYAFLHPLDHLNLGQSTNDVYPTAVRIALVGLIADLRAALTVLRGALVRQAERFADVVKIGRTQLQDAVPMTLGQEFGAWARSVGEEDERLAEAARLLAEVNLGGTAIGTSVNAAVGYPQLVLECLRDITGIPLVVAPDLVEATSDTGAYVAASSAVKRTALKVAKVCNDLRLLASGPHAGLGELVLPAVQSGSSIMPGKVNPVIPEAVNQVVFEVMGCDLTVNLAAGAGQLQLNAFQPVIAVSLFRAIRQFDSGCRLLATRCVNGIEANVDRLNQNAAADTGVLTALAPRLGYETATELSRVAARQRRTLEDILLDRGLVTPAELRVLSGAVLTPRREEA
jgi:aspartate ammonia-lyase